MLLNVNVSAAPWSYVYDNCVSYNIKYQIILTVCNISVGLNDIIRCRCSRIDREFVTSAEKNREF